MPGGNLVMDYIPQSGLFSIGEVVLTSGLGGRFPKGIPIGQVVEIRQRDIDVFQQAVVRPTVDFSRLELVMVVTNFDPLEDVPELLVPVTPEEEAPAETLGPSGDEADGLAPDAPEGDVEAGSADGGGGQ